MTSQLGNWIPIKDVARRLGVTPSTVYDWIRAERFPPGVRLSTKATRWNEQHVLNWILSQPKAAPPAIRNHSMALKIEYRYGEKRLIIPARSQQEFFERMGVVLKKESDTYDAFIEDINPDYPPYS